MDPYLMKFHMSREGLGPRVVAYLCVYRDKIADLTNSWVKSAIILSRLEVSKPTVY